jgi:hypothetical protein
MGDEPIADHGFVCCGHINYQMPVASTRNSVRFGADRCGSIARVGMRQHDRTALIDGGRG